MVWKYEFLKCDFGFMESWNHHVPFNSSTDCSFKITEGTLKILTEVPFKLLGQYFITFIPINSKCLGLRSGLIV